MNFYGEEDISDKRFARKILIGIPEKFDLIIVATENTNDFSILYWKN